MQIDIYITDEPNFIVICIDTKFHVSKDILSSSSSVWSAMLQDKSATEVPLNEDKDGLHQVLLLCHEYSPKVDQDQIRSMMFIGFKYDIKCVIEYCETHLTGEPIDIFTLGNKYHSSILLQRGGTGLIKGYDPKDLKSLDKSALLYLINQYAGHTKSLEDKIQEYQSLIDIQKKKKFIKYSIRHRRHSSKKSSVKYTHRY